MRRDHTVLAAALREKILRPPHARRHGLVGWQLGPLGLGRTSRRSGVIGTYQTVLVIRKLAAPSAVLIGADGLDEATGWT